MSYPPLGGYYGSNTGQTTQKYGAGNEQVNNANACVNGHQQGHYGSYNWHDQNQQAAANNASSAYGGSATWRESRTQPSAYDYSRQPEYYQTTPDTVANTSSYQNLSRESYAQPTQRLDHLAYASGLEPGNQRDQSTSVSNKQHMENSGNGSYVNSASGSYQTVPVNRIRSPLESKGSRGSISQTMSHPMQQQMSSDSTSSHNMAINAAVALAEAVNTRNRLNQQPAVSEGTASPVTTNAFPRQTSVPRMQSPSIVDPNLVQTAKNYNPVLPQKLPQSQQVQQRKQTSTQPLIQQQQQQQKQSLPPPSSLKHNNSISHLVSAPSKTRDDIDDSSVVQETMPTFIDPTQVFNPYHREHERKKKEAAEAEARRIAEAARQAEAAKKVEETKLNKAVSNKPRDSAMANSKTKISKKSDQPPQPSKPVQSIPAVHSASDISTAEEMKLLMERMLSMRTKDPQLFSKLWNDVRAKDVNGNANTQQSNSPQVAHVDPPATAAATQMLGDLNAAKAPAAEPGKHDLQSKKTNTTQPGIARNGYKVVVENNPENLPDLGRYPAERRIRPSYGKRTHSEVADAAKAAGTGPIQAAKVNEPTQAAPSVQQVLSTANADTAWPEPRRRAVAIAAIHLLKSNPENKDNPIIAQDIATLLEQNPSYLDLCAALERRGLKFQRTVFAKDLLKTVPDLGVNQSEQVPDAILDVQVSSAVPNVEPSKPTVSPSLVKSEPSVRSKQTKQRRSSLVARPEPQLGTKEAAARKRDFSELVDMTNLCENEDYVAPSKKMRIENEQPLPNSLHTFQDEPGRIISQEQSATFAVPNSVTPLRFDIQAAARSPVVQSAPTPIIAQTQPSLSATPQSQQSRMIIAKKLNKAEAVQKSYFDPRTVARDVLIASGRHPSERPLNVHLAGMLNKYIELDSDVSTFDWDAVDPGGPPLRQVDYVDIPATRPKFRPKHKLDSRTSMHAIENLQTRLPKEERRRLTPQFASPQPAAQKDGDNLIRLSKSKQQRSDQDEHRARITTPQMRKVSVDIPIDRSAQPSIRSTSRAAQTSGRKSSHTMESDPPSTVKRRGRPPGAKNKFPSVSELRKQAASLRIDLPPAPPAEPDIIPEPRYLEYKCKWRQCKAQLHNLDTLRKHMPKRHAPSKEDREKPDFIGFICWWKNCPLLQKVEDGIMPTKSFDSEAEWLQHIESEHIQRLADAIGDGPPTTHTDPQRTELDRQRYLCDENGREVTPVIDLDGGQDLPADPLVLMRHYPHGPSNEREKADLTAQSSYLKAHGTSKDPRRRAVEIVRAMAARKAMIGPGIDRGGCTLINEARRSTFVQNPGIIRLIDAEY